MKRTMLSLVLIALLASGCGTIYNPKTYPDASTATINRPHDIVWGRTMDWLVMRGSPIVSAQKAEGLIMLERNANVPDTSYCDCGAEFDGWGRYVEYWPAYATVRISIQPLDQNQTSVHVGAEYKYTKFWDCNSTGRYERELIEYIKR